ncbi:hypothetical protein ACFVSS_06950 [Peribacillus butanolivorans]|uniref:hypothetical protein n=1 Tax=Peribacillus butanolivorans TaxID=421767 RepID=UPI0036DD2501
MEIYPIQLRKKRINYKQKPFLNEEVTKLNERFEGIFRDLESLKEHLIYMENKYKPKDEDI